MGDYTGPQPGRFGLLSKTFRRTQRAPPREARSGALCMSEDVLESNPKRPGDPAGVKPL